MAKIAKSKDTANYRKGSALVIGDEIAVAWTGTKATEFAAITSIELVDASTLGQRGGRQYRVTLDNGKSRVFAGTEFAEGRYAA